MPQIRVNDALTHATINTIKQCRGLLQRFTMCKHSSKLQSQGGNIHNIFTPSTYMVAATPWRNVGTKGLRAHYIHGNPSIMDKATLVQ
jgi:hypothetical protein